MAPKPKKPPTEAELVLQQALTAIGDRPSDDGARRVFADLLLEKGDPRGEYLMLQFLIGEGRGNPTLIQRANVLFRKYRRSWTAGVEGLLHAFDYRSGFPVEATFRTNPTPAALEAALASPVMATLEVLRQGAASTPTMVKALTSPRLRLLAGAEVNTSDVLIELARRGPPPLLQRLRASCDPGKAIGEGAIFKSLRELKVPGPAVSAVELGKLLALPQLEKLVISSATMDNAKAVARRWPQLKLRSVELAPFMWLRREEAGTVVTFQNASHGGLKTYAQLVPEETARVELAISGGRSGYDSETSHLGKPFARWPVKFIP